MKFKYSFSESCRLDKAILKLVRDISRSQIEKMIKEGLVLLNGTAQQKCGEIVHQGDEIEILVDKKVQTHANSFYPLELPVIYENEWFLAINKPPGLAVHPGPGTKSPTVIDFSKKYLKIKKEFKNFNHSEFGIVHRLDKDTSGVLLIAKTAASQRKLSELFRKREIKKKYISFNFLSKNGLFNTSEDGEIKCWILRDTFNRIKYSCSWTERRGSRECLTKFKRVFRCDKIGFIELYPITGRTHQLRAVSAFLKCPVVNDPIYSSGEIDQLSNVRLRDLLNKAKRLMLHAQKVQFICPFSKNLIEIQAPIPDEFQAILTFCYNHPESE